MNEKQIKEFSKFYLANGHRKLNDDEKEIIKFAIDQSPNLGELSKVAIAGWIFDLNR